MCHSRLREATIGLPSQIYAYIAAARTGRSNLYTIRLQIILGDTYHSWQLSLPMSANLRVDCT